MASTQSGMANGTQASSSGYISNNDSPPKSTVLGAADEVGTTTSEDIPDLQSPMHINEILHQEACKDHEVAEERVNPAATKTQIAATAKACQELGARVRALQAETENLRGTFKCHVDEVKTIFNYLCEVAHARNKTTSEPLPKDTAANIQAIQRWCNS